MEKLSVRIDNFECRKTSTNLKRIFEIVRWYNNPYYGKESAYISDGYTESKYYFSKDSTHISKTCFKDPESCFVVAYLELNFKEPDITLTSVGNRILELTEEELSTFMEVYRTADTHIRKKYFKDTSDE